MHGRIFAYTTVDLIANREALNDIWLPASDSVHDDMPDVVDYVVDGDLIADLPLLEKSIGVEPEIATVPLLDPESPAPVAVIRGERVDRVQSQLRQRALERASEVRKMLTREPDEKRLVSLMHLCSELLWPKYDVYFCCCDRQNSFVGNELDLLYHLQVAKPKVVTFIWSYDYHF
mgnify:CR=1 FL=1